MRAQQRGLPGPGKGQMCRPAGGLAVPKSAGPAPVLELATDQVQLVTAHLLLDLYLEIYIFLNQVQTIISH